MAVRISKRESFRATCASLGVPRSNNDFPARNFRGYACFGYAYFGYAYLFNSTLEIGVIRVYICIYPPIISPSVVFVLTIVSLSLSLSFEDVSIYRGEALIEFRCYLRVEFKGGGLT